MGTPSTQPADRTIRVNAQTHAKLAKLAAHLNGTMAEAVEWHLQPGILRIALGDQRKQRWAEAAAANGMSLAEFVNARVEAAIQYGADPGGLRRVHDLVLALCKAQGVIPPATPPGADRQVVTEGHSDRP